MTPLVSSLAMYELLLYSLYSLLPILAGLLCLLISGRFKGLIKTIALLISLLVLALTIMIFSHQGEGFFILNDGLSRFILLAIGLFGVLTVIYSFKFMAGYERLKEYYAYILMTLGAACGVVLAGDIIFLLIFWGFLGLTLYLLIGMGGPKAAPAAKKTLIIVGGTDALMVLGVVLLRQLGGSFAISDIMASPLPLTGGLAIFAYLCLVSASFAKAGAMPFHTWVPDTAETAPVPVTAFLPAALDKLLGIYLLARISLYLFVLSEGMKIFLMTVGAVTIMAAVMMALIQHNYKKLLGYHAVSQVGYMVLGIGTGIPVGVAGGLFHMLNNAIYKQGLFLAGGAVEKQTGTDDLDKLGGLAKAMPITFVTCLIASLSISGIPPLNGFVSKWMVYQGVIELGKMGGKLWIVWLAAAMFGSALTLASFMKLIHATFLGKGTGKNARIKEVSSLMWVPMAALALLCVLFGVFARSLPLKHFILPAVERVSFTGLWSSSLATGMIILGVVIGLVIYLLGNIKGFREDTTYIGGEVLPDETRVSGVNFYNTVKEIPLFKAAYDRAERKVFDIYDQGRKLSSVMSEKLREIHTGLLPAYLLWSLFGMLILFFILRK